MATFYGGANTSQNKKSSYGGYSGYSSASQEDQSIEELLTLAELRGGRTSQVAKELSGGTHTILSTIGTGMKNAFTGLIDTISIPGQVVAGMISDKYTVQEAIKENIRVSDVIFGEGNIDFDHNGKTTTMEKIGDFVVRLPVDIISDPTTYITFGASSAKGLLGKMGFKYNQRLDLGKDAAEALGKTIDDGDLIQRSFSDFGADVLSYNKRIENIVKKGGDINKLDEATLGIKKSLIERGVDLDTINFLEKETDKLVKETIDSSFDLNSAKKAMSNLFAKNPILVSQFIDKGGIKFAGKTILDAQRIAKVSSIIPGMKYIDNITQPFRQSVQALFDTNLVSMGNGVYKRIPEEVANMKRQLKTLKASGNLNLIDNLANVQKEFDLNEKELDILSSAINTSILPSDPKLSSAYYRMLGISDDMVEMFKKAGIPLSKLDNWTGNILVNDDLRPMFGKNSAFAKKPGATMQATNFKAIPLADVGEVQKIPEVSDVLNTIKDDKELSDVFENISKSRSVEDVQKAIGSKRDELVKNLTKDGTMSIDDALKDTSVTKLNQLQDTVKNLKTEGILIGKKETNNLVYKNTEDEIKRIISEADDKIYKLGISKDSINKEIATLALRISDIMKSNITGKLSSVLNNLPSKSKDNIKVLIQKIEDYVGSADIEKLKSTYKNENLFESIEEASKGIKILDTDSKLKMIRKVLKDEKMIQLDIEELNKSIKNIIDLKEKKDLSKKAEFVLSEDDMNNVKKLYEESRAAKFALVNRDLDGNATSKLIEILKDEFNSNPVGAKNIIKSIIGNESKLNDVISLIDDTKFQTRRQIGLLPEEEAFFTDNSDKIYKRVAATSQELESKGFTGFDKNLLTAWTTRGLQNINQVLGHEFTEGFVRSFGRWADEAPDTWVTMSNAIVNDEAQKIASKLVRADGTEMAFHPVMAKIFDDTVGGLSKQDDAIKGFIGGYDKLQKYYKSYLTTLFPMFHGRNAISNVFLNYMDIGYNAINPEKNFMAGQMIKYNRDLEKLRALAVGSGDEATKAMSEIANITNKTMFTDRAGYDWTFGELESVMKKNNIAFNKNIPNAADIETSNEALTNFFFATKKDKLKKQINPFDVDNFKPVQYGREVGRAIEEHSRSLNFITNLINTGDVSHAVSRTNQFLFDYSNLTKFEKEWMKRIFPFYTFTKNNLRLHYQTLTTAPGKIASEVKVIKSLGDVLGGETMTQEEVDLLPPWMRSSINIKKQQEDGTYKVITGFGLPLEQPFQQFQPSAIVGSLSPLIKNPIEWTTGYNLFKGKMTSDVTDAKDFRDAPEFVKDFIGYTEWEGKTKEGENYTVRKATRPENMQLILQAPFSRFISTYSKISDKETDKDMKWLQTLTGINAQDFNEDELSQQRQEEQAKALEKILKDSGVLGEYKRVYKKKNVTIIE